MTDYIYAIDFEEYKNTRLGKQAERFDRENPSVYYLLQRFSDDVRLKGYKRYSINSIFERIRWHTAIETNDKDFKINNNHRAYYARKLMANDERFAGFFSVRGEIGS